MRQPKPWLHQQSGNYKVQFGKQQFNLGPDEAVAWEEYHRLMVQRGQHPRETSDPTVYNTMNRYLAYVEAKRSEGTFKNTKRHLKRFSRQIGKRLKVRDLTTDHVEDWIKADYKGLSPTYQNDAIAAVVAAIKHSKLPNPIEGIERPARQQREFWLKPEDWHILLDAISDRRFHDYCLLGLHTGARPQEIKAIEKRHYQKADSRIKFPKAEAKGKKRKRFIYLDDTAREIIERNLRNSGPLLRNRNENAWNKDNVNCRFRRLKVKLNMPELCAYTLRHSFAVWKLSAGLEVSKVAALMGHVNSRMVEQRYGHIDENVELMLRASQTGSLLVQRPDQCDSHLPTGEGLPV